MQYQNIFITDKTLTSEYSDISDKLHSEALPDPHQIFPIAARNNLLKPDNPLSSTAISCILSQAQSIHNLLSATTFTGI
jgi:hypothetical protein